MTDSVELQRWRGLASALWLVALLAWESWFPFLRLFAGSADRWRHGLRNVGLGALNALMVALLFVWGWRAVAGWAAHREFGLIRWLGLEGWAGAAVGVLVFDLWTYWWHRAAHRLPGLWRFHQVHHSDAQMDVTTANRFHLVEIALSSLLRLAVIPLIGLDFWQVALYETLLQTCVQWQHANVGLPPGTEQIARAVVVTPGMHKVHHSRERQDFDSNFASLFSVWDRLFGSFRQLQRPKEVRFGLHDAEAPSAQTVAGLLRSPFRK